MLDLSRRFDPLGTSAHADAAAKAYQRMDDGIGLGDVIEPLNEGAIDLDLVEGESEKIADGRVAGAEVIEGDAHAAGERKRFSVAMAFSQSAIQTLSVISSSSRSAGRPVLAKTRFRRFRPDRNA